jgi:uncharacterized protein YgbK (DUF1537 family)
MGNQASAMGRVSRAYNILKHALISLPDHSKEQQAVMRALTALNTVAGQTSGDTDQAANRQISQMGTAPNPMLAGAPSPGAQLAPLPQRQMNQAMMGAGPTGLQ